MARLPDASILKRVEKKRAEYEGKMVEWGPIGEEVFLRTYARIKPDGSRESWIDTVARVVAGNCGFVDPRHIDSNEVEELFDLLFNQKLLPGGRHLWSSGIPNRAYVSNCWTSGFEKDNWSTHFAFSFARLMEGGGVGSNYSDRYFKRFNKIRRICDLHFVCDSIHPDHSKLEKVSIWNGDYKAPFGSDVAPDCKISLLSQTYSSRWHGSHEIGDSREGWVAALRKLLDQFTLPDGHPDLAEDNTIIFDVSRIRPEGSPLKQFGGTASGPFALVWMLNKVHQLMGTAFHENNGKMDWKLAMDIDHEIARCVVSGNIRRSARMSLKHWEDPDIFDFINLKKNSSSHWSTNISVLVDANFWRKLNRKNGHARAVLDAIVGGIYLNGEPGICDFNQCNEGEIFPFFSTNPCGEIPLPEWGSCNLGSVNLGLFAHNDSGLSLACKLLTRFLIRATFADYPDDLAKSVVDRDRRIGLGFTGFHYWLLRQGIRYSEFPSETAIRQKLADAKKYIRKTARDYAFELRIPEPIKVTTVAPTGTISKLVGTSEGIQAIYAPYYRRRVRFSMQDPDQCEKVKQFKAAGYHVEEDANLGENTAVVTFPVKDSILGEIEDIDLIEGTADVSIADYLSVQAAVQKEWADNSITITINFDPNVYSKEDIADAIKQHGQHVKGLTMMPLVSGYAQPPLEVISKEEYEKEVRKTGRTNHNIGTAAPGCKNGVCDVSTKINGDSEEAVDLSALLNQSEEGEKN